MLSGKGMILGRTTRKGKLITINKYTHLMITAPTGAGKGVSFVIPTLLTYRRGSVFIFDPKGELYAITAKARSAMGQRIIRIDPFEVCGPNSDSFNPFDDIHPGPILVDEARAMAEAIVVRALEGDKDPHWNNSAVMLLTVMLTATLLFMKPKDRNLSTVREMMTDPTIFKEVLARLQLYGGIPARLANQLTKQAESEKELAGVISTANTHCAFLDSELVSMVVSNTSSFSTDVLLEPGTTIYFILPVEQLDAQRNFLRLVVSTLVRHVIRHGVKDGGETLFLLDECSALSGLDALQQAFVLGRGKNIRLYTFWQSIEQAQAAFKKTPNLVLDNSDAQIFFGVNSYATADLISKILGTWTMVTSKANESSSGGRSYTFSATQGTTQQTGWSQSIDYSEHARPLLNPAEVIQLSGEYLIAFVKGCPPIFARRLKYYSDPLFRRSLTKSSTVWWWLLIALISLLVWGLR